MKHTVVAAIGPVTADAAGRLGIPVHVQPTTYTVPALVDAIVGHYGGRRGPAVGEMSDGHGTATARLPLSKRPRRLRPTEAIRALVRETRLTPDCLIYPLFVCEGRTSAGRSARCRASSSSRWTKRCRRPRRRRADGIAGVLLFGLPEHKDAIGSKSSDPSAPVQTAVRAIKRACPACWC